MNTSFRADPYPREREVAFPGGIDRHFISGAHRIEPGGPIGEWIPDPHYYPVP